MATRRERVVLELEDQFSSPMARSAAATALLNKELNSLSKDSVQTRRNTRAIGSEIDGLGRSSVRAEREVDRLSGRMRILADVGAALGPGLVPISAVALPAITGLAASLGFAAVGTGVLVTAFQGMGEALTDLNDAALDPTAENLEKAQASLDALSPSAQDFAKQLRVLMPALNDLQELAAEGVLPGFSDGLEGALTRLPAVERLVTSFSTALGDIGDNLGEAIEAGRVDEFLAFLAEEGPDALEDFGAIVGQTSLGLANLWMAFTPLNDDFSTFLVESTADFEEWTRGLAETDGFQEFVDYVRTNGPQVADTLSAIGSAAVQIVQAVAPLGGPSLRVLEAVAETVGDIADSELGTPVFGLIAALGLLNTSVRIFQGLQKATFGGPAVALIGQNEAAVRRYGSTLRTALNVVGVVGGLNLLGSTIDDLFDRNIDDTKLSRSLSQLAGGAVAGEVAKRFQGDLSGIVAQLEQVGGGGLNAGLRGVAGFADRFQAGFLVDNPFDKSVGFDTAAQNIKALDSALASLVESGRGPTAAAIIEQLTGAGASPEQIAKGFEQYGIAVKNAATETDKLGTSTKTTVDKVAEAKRVLDGVRDEAGRAAAGFLGFDDTLNKSTTSLDAWITNLNKQATALQNFAANAETATRRGLADGLVKQLADAGPEGALRLKQLADAGDAEIARANRAFERGQAGIKQYQDVADGLEPIVLDVATEKAEDSLTRMEVILDRLGIGVTVPIKVTFEKGKGPLTPLASALSSLGPGGLDGDPNTPYWNGGYTGRGGKFEPAGIVHKGEFVFSAAATSGNEALLADLHRRMRGYANGGLVGSTTSHVSNQYFNSQGASIDYGRLAVAMSEARPLYGDAHFYGDDSAWRRQMEQDKRMQSVGGF